MELIQHKTYGPLAALKSSYSKQMILVSLLPFFMLLTYSFDLHGVLTSILFWSYTAFCIGVAIFSYYNYRTITQMEMMDGMIKANLEQQIVLLQKMLHWKLIAMRCVTLFFVLLLEVVPYIQNYSMLNKWHELPWYIRFGSYTAFAAMQYFLNKAVARRKVGRHLDYLQRLVNDMH